MSVSSTLRRFRPSSVGVLVLEEEDEKGLDLGAYAIYITVIAWIMVGIGALYFLLVREGGAGLTLRSPFDRFFDVFVMPGGVS